MISPKFMEIKYEWDVGLIIEIRAHIQSVLKNVYTLNSW